MFEGPTTPMVSPHVFSSLVSFSPKTPRANSVESAARWCICDKPQPHHPPYCHRGPERHAAGKKLKTGQTKLRPKANPTQPKPTQLTIQPADQPTSKPTDCTCPCTSLQVCRSRASSGKGFSVPAGLSHPVCERQLGMEP